jgi:hypothetical protein
MTAPSDTPRITLSCGCQSHYFGFPSEWDAETREGGPAIAHGVLCEIHYHEYQARPAGERALIEAQATLAAAEAERSAAIDAYKEATDRAAAAEAAQQTLADAINAMWPEGYPTPAEGVEALVKRCRNIAAERQIAADNFRITNQAYVKADNARREAEDAARQGGAR